MDPKRRGRSARRRLRLHRGCRTNTATAGLFFRSRFRLGRDAERGRQAVGVEAGRLARILHLGGTLAARTTATAGRFLLDLGSGSGLGGHRSLHLFGRFGHDRLFGTDGTAILAGFPTRTIVAVATRALVARLIIALIRLTRLALATRFRLALLFAGADGIALVAIILGVVVEAVVILIVARFLALATLILFLEARAAFAQHPEIVIGELPIIFGVDAVTLALCLGRQILVLFVQLVGVAARAVVDAIAIVGATRVPTRTLPTIIAATTTATAAGLPIIDQAVRP